MSSDVVVIEDGEALIVVDERSWPIVTSTWFGAATVPLVDAYFAHSDRQLDRAKASHAQLVMITDTYATKPPPAKVRQRIAELSRVQSPRSQPVVLDSITIVENALIRGVVTALSWIDPSMARTKNVGSYQAALDEGLATLKAAGIAPPAVLPTRQRLPAVRETG
jgi:hypothetical protein